MLHAFHQALATRRPVSLPPEANGIVVVIWPGNFLIQRCFANQQYADAAIAEYALQQAARATVG